MAVLLTPALPFRHSRRLITEPDGFGDAVTGISLAVDFQRRQEGVSAVEQFQSPDWALDFGEANVRSRVRGVLNGGFGSFCLARGPGQATWNSQLSRPGSISLFPPEDELDGHCSAGFHWMTAAIPPAVWERCLALAGTDPGTLRRLTVCQLPGSFLAEMENRLRSCQLALRESTSSPQRAVLAELAVRDTAAFVTDCFTSLCETASGAAPPRDSARNRARLAGRARAWMHEHLSEPVQVPDVCLAMGVSRRELEYAFRSVFDQSPREFLQVLRLNAIRRTLLVTRGRGMNSIIAIAHAHGVTHLGRFAANYRSLFGEKPADTVRK